MIQYPHIAARLFNTPLLIHPGKLDAMLYGIRDRLGIDVATPAPGLYTTEQGERKEPEITDSTWHRRERGFGAFSRTFELPSDVDAGKVEARLNHGVLLIELPKREAEKPRRIEVKSG